MLQNRLFLYLYRLRQRLWVKPVIYCVVAVVTVLLAWTADLAEPMEALPDISADTIEELLSILSSTMLVMATFAVGSMLAAYSSASNNATPRALELVLTDDLSKTALSSFVGAFIFSVVGIVAVKTELYGQAGRFALFVATIAVIILVIATFVRWVDNIARLGRMPSTINRAEAAARDCLRQRRETPYLGARDAAEAPDAPSTAIHAEEIGYVQFVDVQKLQDLAEKADLQVIITAMPGQFVMPDKPLMQVIGTQPPDAEQRAELREAFVIGDERTFEADPRFGLIVLSEIAQRALSSGVNDPGTAIVIVGRLVRLFAFWLESRTEERDEDEICDRVFVPALRLADMLDDAFTGIVRDGAGNVQLGIRLQKAFASLAALGDPEMRAQAERLARAALRHAEAAIEVEHELERLRESAKPLLDAA